MKSKMPLMIITGILFILSGAVLLYVLFLNKENPERELKSLRVHETIFSVEVAETMLELTKGLSGRETLAEKHGMLFRFSSLGNHGIWMKEMQFPIDIVWIKGDTILGVTERVMPDPTKPFYRLPIYYTPELVDTVLELRAGEAEKYGLLTGMNIVLE